MRLLIEQSLAAGFIPINTRQERTSLPFKHGVLEKKVYNNDNITFFSILTFTKPMCDHVLQPSALHGLACNTLSHLALANVITQKVIVILLFHYCNEFHIIGNFPDRNAGNNNINTSISTL